MASEVYHGVNLQVPITEVLSFPNKVLSSDAAFAKIEDALKDHKWVKEGAAAPKLLNKDWLVGVEVEAEHVSLEKFTSFQAATSYGMWTAKPDNSLRNNGMEFVSSPMRGARVATALAWLTEALGPKIDFSARTSVHVHLNVRDLTLEQLISLALTYAVVERLLFRWIGNNREKNIFCVPMYSTRDLSGLYSSVHSKLKKPISHKYSALNLNTCCQHPDVPLYGTVEFRHMYGTMDLDVLTTWINMIFGLKKAAMARPLSDQLEKIVSLNTSSAYAAFVKSVFGEQAQLLFGTLAHPDQLTALMEPPVMEVKRSTFVNDFHTQLLAGYPSVNSPFTKGLKKHFGVFQVASAKKPSDGNPSEGVPLTPSENGSAAMMVHLDSTPDWGNPPAMEPFFDNEEEEQP